MLSIRNTHTHTHIVRHTCIEIEKDFWANDEVILLAALGFKSGLNRWSCGLCFGFSCGSYAGWLTDCRSVNITQAWELAGWLAALATPRPLTTDSSSDEQHTLCGHVSRRWVGQKPSWLKDNECVDVRAFNVPKQWWISDETETSQAKNNEAFSPAHPPPPRSLGLPSYRLGLSSLCGQFALNLLDCRTEFGAISARSLFLAIPLSLAHSLSICLTVH